MVWYRTAAALDYRVDGIFIKISPLSVGWAKLQEIAKYIAYFRASGKWSVAYLDRGGEKEYFLASCCAEVFVPPSGNLFLRGLAVSGVSNPVNLSIMGHNPEACASLALASWRSVYVGLVACASSLCTVMFLLVLHAESKNPILGPNEILHFVQVGLFGSCVVGQNYGVFSLTLWSSSMLAWHLFSYIHICLPVNDFESIMQVHFWEASLTKWELNPKLNE